jgi:hypothetical protein
MTFASRRKRWIHMSACRANELDEAGRISLMAARRASI